MKVTDNKKSIARKVSGKELAWRRENKAREMMFGPKRKPPSPLELALKRGKKK